MRPDFWVRSFAIVGDARGCLIEGVVVMRELVVWFEVVCGQILAKAGDFAVRSATTNWDVNLGACLVGLGHLASISKVLLGSQWLDVIRS
jgi:hypothetical protein